eukprot:TRINITY_DN844_c0_g1_i8.p2 TRINITY_DN844_c0_g1~~TRINITY_DN844_c0_g1_i8.p2  ORF type:complete len:129 (-),score=28.52 TRINITY_DN844_c0_g1_i8:293-679(-)
MVLWLQLQLHEMLPPQRRIQLPSEETRSPHYSEQSITSGALSVELLTYLRQQNFGLQVRMSISTLKPAQVPAQSGIPPCFEPNLIETQREVSGEPAEEVELPGELGLSTTPGGLRRSISSASSMMNTT